ncbi:transposase [Bacteroidales bacterium OttesenSCG-928-B11]|nr:transposase [Bacteroidales bacterium OttesenSCG-928-B11]
MEKYIGPRRALAIDPSFIHKSGKHTPCVSYFWSGCAGKALRGLEILAMSIIDASTGFSFHLQASQTLPSNFLKDRNLTLPDWYAAVIKANIAQILEITTCVAADAFFSKKGFVDDIIGMGLRLVCKLRDDADLRYLCNGGKSGKRGKPAKYDGKVDPANLDEKHFSTVPNDRGVKAKAGIVYSKSLKRNILLVVEEMTIKGKTIRRLLFSTDTNQAPVDVIDIYHTRFQMEFGFRDAKQFAGLENVQAHSVNKLDFHFNAALTSVNIAKIIQLNDERMRELPFSMRTYKTLFYNRLPLSLFSAKFGISANTYKNQEIFNELLIFGTMAA